MNEDNERICGFLVEVDLSGAGHHWVTVAKEYLPPKVREEIEGEMIDGKKNECDLFVASNGLHYRW